MLQILNKTPFQAALTLMTDQYGTEKVVVAVKGTFKIPGRSEKVQLAEKQLPILYADEYYGEPGKSSIKYPVDLVLGKINTDVGLIGSAFSSGGKRVKQLPVYLKVGQLQKSIMVIGDRHWEKRALMPGFQMTEPESFTELPIIYERAFGGVDQTHKDEKKHGWYSQNPIGTGFRLNDNAVENHHLPNLEDPTQLISSWKDKPSLSGFGFIDGHWEPRVGFAGTFDEKWRENHCPLLPLDFDLRFFNAAPLDLISKGFLLGGESVQLVNLSKKGNLEFSLPKLDIKLMFRLGESRNPQKADLWTVVFEPPEDRFYLVWGGSFDFGKQPTHLRYVKIEAEGETASLGITVREA